MIQQKNQVKIRKKNTINDTEKRENLKNLKKRSKKKIKCFRYRSNSEFELFFLLNQQGNNE